LGNVRVTFEWWQSVLQNENWSKCIQLISCIYNYQQTATIYGPITCFSDYDPIQMQSKLGVYTVFSGYLVRIMGSGMENPDLPTPPIYRRIFHVPKAAVNQGLTV
jgi:hypothetical protein